MKLEFKNEAEFSLGSKYSEKVYKTDFKTDKKKLFKSCIKTVEKLGYDIEEINDDNLELFFQIKPKSMKNYGYQFIISAIRSGSEKSSLVIRAQTEISSLGALTFEKKRGKELAEQIFKNI